MIHLNKGKPFPLGSSLTSQGINFSLVATNAEYVEILLFEKEDSISPKSIFKLDQTHNTGPYWHAEIKNLDEGCIYACLLYTSPSPRDMRRSRMPSSA